MRLSDLIEERTKVATAMRTLHAEADAAGALAPEKEQRFGALKTELESLEQRIERQSLIDDLDRRASGTTVRESGTDEFTREKRQFSICKLIASSFDPSVDAAREREIVTEQRRLTGRKGDGYLVPFECLIPDQRRMETRVLTYAGDGQNLVSTTVLGNEFIDALRPASVSTRLGARVITGLVADIALPRRDARTPTAAWFVENNAITSGDQSFDQVTGAPHHLGLITEFGRRTMLQATPDIEQLTRQHLVEELAVGVDLAVLKGSGSAGQPRGISQTSGINTVTSSGSAPTWAQLLSAVSQVEAADVPPVALGWALNAYVKSTFLQTTKVSSDAGAGFLMDADGRVGGAPSAVTSQLAGLAGVSPAQNGETIFGSWNQVIVAMWSGVEILVNPFESTAYSKGNVSVRGIVDADVLVRHPQAFTLWSAIQV
jgi:HK97 family phage major capsid protein